VDENDEPSDGFRALGQLAMADCRMQHFVVRQGHTTRPIRQEDRYEAIGALALSEAVPQLVRVHYDTARNLFLYAWHVYRFHVVAEHQALASLELALRTAFIERGDLDAEGRLPSSNAGPSKQSSKPRRLYLRDLLLLASSKKLVVNEGFTRRIEWAQQLAERRRSLEQIAYMQMNMLEEMRVPDEPAVPTEEDFEADWLSDLAETLPEMRNRYAHGSSTVYPGVLRTFEIVRDLVDQLWPPAESISVPASR
jgi:hypothetical protein